MKMSLFALGFVLFGLHAFAVTSPCQLPVGDRAFHCTYSDGPDNNWFNFAINSSESSLKVVYSKDSCGSYVREPNNNANFMKFVTIIPQAGLWISKDLNSRFMVVTALGNRFVCSSLRDQ